MDFLEDGCRPGRGLPPGTAGHEEGQGDVFEGRELGQEVEELEDEPDLPVPDPGQPPLVAAEEVVPVEEDRPLGRPVEGPQEMKERRLPDPGGAHDGDDVARPSSKSSPWKTRRVPLGEGVSLAQVHGAEERLTHISGRSRVESATPGAKGRASRGG